MTSGCTHDGTSRTGTRGRRARVVDVATTMGASVSVAVSAWSGGASLPFACLGALVCAAAVWVARTRRTNVLTCVDTAREGRDRDVVAAVTEERRNDAARRLVLELAADRSSAVLDSLREGVIVVDGAGEVVLANPEARHALRDAQASPVGRTLWDVLPEKLADAARQAWEILNGDACPIVDGAQDSVDRTARFSSIPLGDRVFDLTAVHVRSRQSGHDFGTAFLFIDTTRNHELAQLKDRFLSSVSHELRTPLTNICAYAEILRNLVPGESAEWPDFVRIVHDESVQLSRIVDAVFDYLQLESGDARFTIAPTDGVAAARAAFASRRDRARDLGIELAFEGADGLPPIEADAARFVQVCDHLIDNGLKFTPRGGRVRVRVSMDDGHFCLRVDDSGPGVPGSERQTVFDKFHQLHDHLTEKPSGAGLGLATSRVIVSRLGGVIWCEESDLGGAAFVVVLPVVGGPRLQPIDAVGSGAF